MSSNLAYAAPRRAPHERPERRIEIVTTRAQRRARPRPFYAIVAIGGIFVLFMAQLLVSIVISDGAYQISSLQSKQVELTRTAQSLGEKVDTLASTQNLAAKAESLGMVQSTASPAFLDAATGKIVGTSHAVKPTDDGILNETGSLVPNALLPNQPTDGTDTSGTDGTDGANGTAAGTTSTATTTDTTTTGTTGATLGTATSGTEVADEGGIVVDGTGAPTAGGGTPSVPSDGGIPTPVTH